jgi:hypothetical protein
MVVLKVGLGASILCSEWEFIKWEAAVWLPLIAQDSNGIQRNAIISKQESFGGEGAFRKTFNPTLTFRLPKSQPPASNLFHHIKSRKTGQIWVTDATGNPLAAAGATSNRTHISQALAW